MSGYGCEDHFLERDTVEHGYEVLAWLLQRTAKMDLLCDVSTRTVMIIYSQRYCRTANFSRLFFSVFSTFPNQDQFENIAGSKISRFTVCLHSPATALGAASAP